MKLFYPHLIALLLLCLGMTPTSSFGQYLYTRAVSIVYDSKAYWEYLPLGYTPKDSANYPLMVYIHGAGDYGNGSPTDMKLILRSGPLRVMSLGQFPDSFNVNGKSFRFIVIAPQFVVQPNVSAIDSVINFCIAKYKVDPSRIYLTGLSIGGAMTWEYAGGKSPNANRLAAIVPIAGDAIPDSIRGRTMATSNLPVWATHNDGDPLVPVQWSILQVGWINDAPQPNPLAMLTILHGTTHDAWTVTYSPTFTVNNLNVYQWMLSHSRANQPPVVGIGRNQNISLPTSSTTISGSASTTLGAIVSHVWTFVTGPTTPVIVNPSYNVSNVLGMTLPGIYTFKFSATDNGNLTGSATTQITVTSPVTPAAADTTFTSAIATTIMPSSDSNALSDQSISLFPNPTQGLSELHISNPFTGRLKVDLFSQNGALIKEFVLTKPAIEMDTQLSLEALSPGGYILVATIGSWRRSWRLLKL
jgi:poly(3-hydroxybutyrate) depolymerase